MQSINILGIDLAKNVFQLCGVDARGKVVLVKRVRRAQLLLETSNLQVGTIALEACSGAHYWAREFAKQGHQVRLVAAQHVKPFVRTNKNDRNDAQAITEASQRPNIHFVPVKNIERQDIQSVHRIRERVMTDRIALTNEIRGLLHEYGFVFPLTIGVLKKGMVKLFENEGLTALFRRLVRRTYDRLIFLEGELKYLDEELAEIFESNEVCRRLEKIEGVGRMTATAIYAAVSDPNAYKCGRQFSAWLGLVPKQNSSGNTVRLGGISKRGDVYLRTLLIHGGRSVVRWSLKKKDKRSVWALEKRTSRGINKACVAVANKNARIIWALLAKGTEYKQAV